jgi:hypothetical protein
MSRNGSGVYSLPAGNPVVTGTTISSTWANNTLSDIATALTGSVSADGQTPIIANIPMSNFKFTGLGAGSALTDSVTYGQVQNSGYTYLTSVAGTNTITATATPTATAYATGQHFRFIAAATNTGAATLNINSLGAKAITKLGTTALTGGEIVIGAMVCVSYDGTQFQLESINSTPPTQLRSITATVAANALTLGTAAQTLDFRNATLTNGAPVTGVAVGALSLVVPSSATLGTDANSPARLVLIVAYNGGSPVLCVTSLEGGLNLDETNLISPTTISAGSTSAGVIYSASAVGASSPYRVVGFIDITEATPGTWATAPTLIQGIGGQALAALSSIGYGQTWQGLTLTKGTTYYNTYGKPIMVIGTVSSSGTYILTVGGTALGTVTNPVGTGALYVAIIPPNQSYVGSGTGDMLWTVMR